MCKVLRRLTELSSADRARYEWQLDVEGLGESGQLALKRSSALVTRCGGLGGVVAFELAAAGVGRLVLAHGGVLRESDLNRQLLARADPLGISRIQTFVERLREFNDSIEIEGHGENVGPENVERLVSSVDIVVDCAPLFEERFLLNSETFRQRKPMVEAAMYEMETHLTTFLPGRTPCLKCLYPEHPKHWRRRFPVFGAVSGSLGCLAAMEVIKTVTGIGDPLFGAMLVGDLRDMTFRKVKLARNLACSVCESG